MLITVGALMNLGDDNDDDDNDGLHDIRVNFTLFKLENRTVIGPLVGPTLFR